MSLRTLSLIITVFALFTESSVLRVEAGAPGGMLSGIGQLGKGIDMRIGQPFTMAVRQQIVNMTWNLGKTVRVSGVSYTYPDQLSVVAYPGIDASSLTQVFLSVQDVEKQLCVSLSAGGTIPWTNGTFSQSFQADFFNQNSQLHGNYTAFSNQRVTSYFASIESGSPTSAFEKVIGGLPSVLEPDTEEYFCAFFKVFGTDLLSRGVFGGDVTMSTSFSADITYHLSVSEISYQVGVQFKYFKANGSLSYEQKNELAQLNIDYVSNMTLVGGDPGAPSDQWIASVPGAEVLIQCDLLPIYYLAKTKKAVLKQARDSYIRGKMCG